LKFRTELLPVIVETPQPEEDQINHSDRIDHPYPPPLPDQRYKSDDCNDDDQIQPREGDEVCETACIMGKQRKRSPRIPTFNERRRVSADPGKYES